jgi:putative hydrolase of the HAD superfamily
MVSLSNYRGNQDSLESCRADGKKLMKTMKYRAVIFDLFGTLVDNFSSPEYQRILAEMADILQVPPDDFSQAWRESFPLRVNGTHATHLESIEYICQQLGAPVTGRQVRRAADLRLDYTVRTLVPRPGTIETLGIIRRLGYKTALISDCSPETPAVWDSTPFVNCFDVTVFSCVAGIKKPDPRIYRLATDRLGVAPEECLYIGDGSSRELTGARAVGMDAVLIRDPGESADTHFIDREDDWPGPVISTPKQVLDLLE